MLFKKNAHFFVTSESGQIVRDLKKKPFLKIVFILSQPKKNKLKISKSKKNYFSVNKM